MYIYEIENALRQLQASESHPSKWTNGIFQMAESVLRKLPAHMEVDETNLSDRLLCGAENWEDYSRSGRPFSQDWEIAETLCTPAELRLCQYGRKSPGGGESWQDVQARALNLAHGKIIKAIDYAGIK